MPIIVFSMGELNLEKAKPRNAYGEYCPGYGIMTDECETCGNGVVHLFGKCIEVYDKAIPDMKLPL